MKVLLLHNYYQHRGGEDAVFEAERELLRQQGETVESLTFHNDAITTPVDKLKTGLKIFYNPSAAKQCQEAIQRFRPDIIHVHNFFPLLSPAVFKVAKQYNTPVVMTLHNFRLICPNALLLREGKICESCVNQPFPFPAIQHGCYRDSKLQTAALAGMTHWYKTQQLWQHAIHKYIALSQFSRQRILDSTLGLKPSQVVVKPNFVFKAEHSNTSSSLSRKGFIYVGRLSEEKGIQTLLETFTQTTHSLTIIGQGPLTPLVEAAAQAHPNITYLGFQEPATVRELLRQAKALILPSTCYENFPLTILEAFSVGTPAITSRVGGLPDIVREGYNGFLAEPGSSQSLLSQIESFLSKADLETLSRNAQATYQQHYTPEENYRLLRGIYDQVLRECRYAS